MTTLDLIKFAELRSKLFRMPIKLVFGIVACYFALKSPHQSFLSSVVLGCMAYHCVSFIYWFVCKCGNWLIGIIVSLIAYFGGMYLYESSAFYETILGGLLFFMIFFFGWVFIDIFHIIRYFILRKKINESYTEEYEPSEKNNSTDDNDTCSFFEGCTNAASVKRRYRDLTKVYHPDNGNGSEEILARINKEYEIMQKKYT